MHDQNQIKIIHTSDWHLGKKLFKKSFLPEQKLFLNWLTNEIINNQIDILVIAGDIFDTPTPPHEAQKIYYDFLKEISSTIKCTVLIISGNHDSGQFLEAPLPFLEDHNIKIWGSISHNPKDHIFKYKKSKQELTFFALPYFRSHEILKISKNSDNLSTDNLLQSIDDYVCEGTKDIKGKKIFIGHHLFGKYELAGSEQALSLSGVNSIGNELLSKHFDYSFLGHIHRKQNLKEKPLIEYSGAPIPFRFTEVGSKQLSCHIIKNDQSIKESIQIPEFRNLHRVVCEIESLESELNSLKELSKDALLTAFLDLTIIIDRPISGLSDQARALLKGSNIELLSFQYKLTKIAEMETKNHIDLNNISAEELFELYYKKKYPEENEIDKKILQDFTFFYNNEKEEQELLQ